MKTSTRYETTYSDCRWTDRFVVLCGSVVAFHATLMALLLAWSSILTPESVSLFVAVVCATYLERCCEAWQQPKSLSLRCRSAQ